MIDDGMVGVQKILTQQIYSHLITNQYNLLLLFNYLFEYLTFNERLVLSVVELKNKSHFLIWKGGGGSSPEKF